MGSTQKFKVKVDHHFVSLPRVTWTGIRVNYNPGLGT